MLNINDYLEKKFINEASNLLIDSLEDYSDYIEEDKNLEYYTELIEFHKIGYKNCAKWMLDADRNLDGFNISQDFQLDFYDCYGEYSRWTDAENIFKFYLDSYVSQLVYSIDEEIDLTDTNRVISLIENWRNEQIKEIERISF